VPPTIPAYDRGHEGTITRIRGVARYTVTRGPTLPHEPVRPHSLSELQHWLTGHGIAYDTWGRRRDGSKPVTRLWQEIASGESWLTDDPPLRQVAVVSLRIESDGKQLTEVGQLMADGAVRRRNSPPTEKLKRGETPAAGALRCAIEELRVVAQDVQIAAQPLSTTVEESHSPSYPGLRTRYLLHTITATIPTLPTSAFTTEEAPDSDAAVLTHHWEWQ